MQLWAWSTKKDDTEILHITGIAPALNGFDDHSIWGYMKEVFNDEDVDEEFDGFVVERLIDWYIVKC